MRSLIAICLVCFLSLSATSQTRRMAHAETGRTHTAQILRNTPLPNLQETSRQLRFMDFDDAYRAVENIVAQNPDSPEALILRARFKLIGGMETEAAADIQLANRLNPYAADLYGHFGPRGVLKLLAYEPELAVQELTTYQKLYYYHEYLDQQALAQSKGTEELVAFEEALMATESDEIEQASILLKKVIKQYPNSAIAYDLYGLVLGKQEQLELAKDAFVKAIELDENLALAWYNLGQTEYRQGNLKNAEVFLDKAIELHPEMTKAYFKRAMVLKEMGDKESALRDYNAVIDLKGESYPKAFLNRGLTKKMLGFYGGALVDLDRALEEFPNDPELWKNRGNLYLLLNLVPKAIDDYTRAIQLEGDYAEAYYNRSLAHFLLFDKISACADLAESVALGYDQAIEIQPYFCTN
ncbi:MAG: tetratricopeptide repeat protein [Bacteroidota bacterium]